MVGVGIRIRQLWTILPRRSSLTARHLGRNMSLAGCSQTLGIEVHPGKTAVKHWCIALVQDRPLALFRVVMPTGGARLCFPTSVGRSGTNARATIQPTVAPDSSNRARRFNDWHVFKNLRAA